MVCSSIKNFNEIRLQTPYTLTFSSKGRSKERDEIKRLLHSIKADHTEESRRVVIVEGEAGIGKTRLLEEFMDDAEEEDFK